MAGTLGALVRLYPSIPSRFLGTLAGDVALILALLLFAWLGLTVHDRVDGLSSLGRGVQGAGSQVAQSFSAAAGAIRDVPLIGGQLGSGLRDAGRSSGGAVAKAGVRGEQAAHDLANLLGLLTWLIPSGLLLCQRIPSRWRQVRRLSMATHALRGAGDPERQRLLAMRAAFSLPYGTLLRHTRDPLGDLQAGKYQGLVAAELAEVGLRPSDRGL